MVMEAMAEHSVDGTVDLDYASSGLTWRLSCPAANALEPADACSQTDRELEANEEQDSLERVFSYYAEEDVHRVSSGL
jgi:hypothetical protein